MPKFEVRIKRYCYFVETVEAENHDAAVEIAEDTLIEQVALYDSTDDEVEIIEVREVEC